MGRGSARAYAYQDTVLMREHYDHLEDAKTALESGKVSRLNNIHNYSLHYYFVIIIDSSWCQGLFPPTSDSLV